MNDLALRAAALHAFLSLAGCATADDDAHTHTDPAAAEPATDVDQDGFSIDDGDCDDLDRSVYPGAFEVSRDGEDSDCDEEDGPIVTGTVEGPLPFAEFEAACELRGGVVQIHAACAGSNACRGMSYGNWGEEALLIEHTCRGMNGCNGWSCVELAAGEGRDGEAVYEASCSGCHGWEGPLETVDEAGAEVSIPQFTVFLPPGADVDAELAALPERSQGELRATIAFGRAGISVGGRATSNMPGFHEQLSLAEVDAVIAYVRSMPLTHHVYDDPDDLP
jgi:mono/diheme cytochrome c family protein